jgi:hypothetical protein
MVDDCGTKAVQSQVEGADEGDSQRAGNWRRKRCVERSADRRGGVEHEAETVQYKGAMRIAGNRPRSGCTIRPLRESAENLRLMRLLDEQYTQAPFYGSQRMTAWLKARVWVRP